MWAGYRAPIDLFLAAYQPHYGISLFFQSFSILCTIQFSNQSLPRETLWVLRGGFGLASQADPVESFVAGDVAKHGLTAMDGGKGK